MKNLLNKGYQQECIHLLIEIIINNHENYDYKGNTGIINYKHDKINYTKSGKEKTKKGHFKFKI